MLPALAQRINELGRPCGAVPRGAGSMVDGEFVIPPQPTAAHLLERILIGSALTGAETVWFHRFLAIAVVAGLRQQLGTHSTHPASGAGGEATPADAGAPSAPIHSNS